MNTVYPERRLPYPITLAIGVPNKAKPILYDKPTKILRACTILNYYVPLYAPSVRDNKVAVPVFIPFKLFIPKIASIVALYYIGTNEEYIDLTSSKTFTYEKPKIIYLLLSVALTKL